MQLSGLLLCVRKEFRTIRSRWYTYWLVANLFKPRATLISGAKRNANSWLSSELTNGSKGWESRVILGVGDGLIGRRNYTLKTSYDHEKPIKNN